MIRECELARSLAKYCSPTIGNLTPCSLASEQYQMGSLTGAVASQNVTEALNGSLGTYRNRAWSVKVEESLTARSTDRAGTKVGLSDPAMHCVLLVAQRIKVTPGITGSSPLRVHIKEEV